ESALRDLVREQGILCAMVEAGGRFSAALFEAGLIDEVVVYTAPLLCGGPLPALAGAGLQQSLSLGETTFEQLGDDVRMSGIIMRHG
ncbi:MAG: dihydrofolate reductase family protein, partial [Luteolibacter sp.]